MRKIILDGSRDKGIVMRTRQVIEGCAPRDYARQLVTIRDWLAGHFRFVRDPQGTECLELPQTLMAMIEKRSVATGDCDDAATLSAAMCKAVGFPVALRIVAFYSPKSAYQHVYTLAFNDGKAFDFDVTRPARMLPPTVAKSFTYPV